MILSSNDKKEIEKILNRVKKYRKNIISYLNNEIDSLIQKYNVIKIFDNIDFSDDINKIINSKDNIKSEFDAVIDNLENYTNGSIEITKNFHDKVIYQIEYLENNYFNDDKIKNNIEEAIKNLDQVLVNIEKDQWESNVNTVETLTNEQITKIKTIYNNETENINNQILIHNTVLKKYFDKLPHYISKIIMNFEIIQKIYFLKKSKLLPNNEENDYYLKILNIYLLRDTEFLKKIYKEDDNLVKVYDNIQNILEKISINLNQTKLLNKKLINDPTNDKILENIKETKKNIFGYLNNLNTEKMSYNTNENLENLKDSLIATKNYLKKSNTLLNNYIEVFGIDQEDENTIAEIKKNNANNLINNILLSSSNNSINSSSLASSQNTINSSNQLLSSSNGLTNDQKLLIIHNNLKIEEIIKMITDEIQDIANNINKIENVQTKDQFKNLYDNRKLYIENVKKDLLIKNPNINTIETKIIINKQINLINNTEIIKNKIFYVLQEFYNIIVVDLLNDITKITQNNLIIENAKREFTELINSKLNSEQNFINNAYNLTNAEKIFETEIFTENYNPLYSITNYRTQLESINYKDIDFIEKTKHLMNLLNEYNIIPNNFYELLNKQTKIALDAQDKIQLMKNRYKKIQEDLEKENLKNQESLINYKELQKLQIYNIQIANIFKKFKYVINNDAYLNDKEKYYYELSHHKDILNLKFQSLNIYEKYSTLIIQKNDKKITLNIYLGEIQNAKTDIIVDTLNENLILGSGVAHAINVYGGPTIQQELNDIKQYMQSYYPDKKYQGLFVTNSGNLINIKQIYHIVGPKYTDINNLELFEKKIAEITLFTLYIFNFNNQESITFPTISTGSFLGSRNNLQSALEAFIISIFYFYDYAFVLNDKIINIVVYKNDVDQYNRIINIIKSIINNKPFESPQEEPKEPEELEELEKPEEPEEPEKEKSEKPEKEEPEEPEKEELEKEEPEEPEEPQQENLYKKLLELPDSNVYNQIINENIAKIFIATNNFTDFTNFFNNIQNLKKTNELQNYMKRFSEMYDYIRLKNIQSIKLLKNMIITKKYNDKQIKNTIAIINKIKK